MNTKELINIKQTGRMVTADELQILASPVSFNESTHCYRLGDLILSGITGIISKVLFPDKYKGIPQSVLDRAAKRGTAIHSDCGAVDIFGEEAATTPEAVSYLEMKRAHGIEVIAGEYLVSDELEIATMIDVVDIWGNLYDIKTTATLDEEYLSWQLSLCARLFERQTGIRPEGLYGIWIREGACRLVEVERKSDEELETLLQAWREGRTLCRPTTTAQESTAVARLVEVEDVITQMMAEVKRMQEVKDEIQGTILQEMKQGGIKSIDSGRIKISLVPASQTKGLDTARIKKERPELLDEFPKITTRAEYLRVTVR